MEKFSKSVSTIAELGTVFTIPATMTSTQRRRELITLDNFESFAKPHPKVLTSPRSLHICRASGILPEELLPKPIEYFHARGVLPEVAAMRHEHYEAKRNQKLQVLRTQRHAYLEQEMREQPSPDGNGELSQSPATIASGQDRGRQDGTTCGASEHTRHVDPALPLASESGTSENVMLRTRTPSPPRPMHSLGRQDSLRLAADAQKENKKALEEWESRRREEKLKRIQLKTDRALAEHARTIEGLQHYVAHRNKDVERKVHSIEEAKRRDTESKHEAWLAKEQALEAAARRAKERTQKRHYERSASCRERTDRTDSGGMAETLKRQQERMAEQEARRRELTEKAREEHYLRKQAEEEHRKEVYQRALERQESLDRSKMEGHLTSLHRHNETMRRTKEAQRLHASHIAQDRLQRVLTAKMRAEDQKQHDIVEKYTKREGRLASTLQSKAVERALRTEMRRLEWEDKREALEQMKRREKLVTDLRAKRLQC